MATHRSQSRRKQHLSRRKRPSGSGKEVTKSSKPSMRTIMILVIVSVLVCMALLHKPSLQLHIPTPMVDPHTDSKSVVVVVEMQALSPSPVEEEDDDGGNSGVAIVLLKCPPSLPYLLVQEYDFSPLLDIVPGYVASNVSIQIPADCHLNNSSIVKNKERVDEVDTNFLRAMQSFLYRYLPLLEETPTSSIPIVSYNNNNGYDYEQCDGCKTTTLSKINKRQEKDGDDNGNGSGNGNPSNLHRRRRRRCNRIRGRRGLWRYDAAYANASYYVDTTWIMGKELANGPYNHSSWMWQQQPSLEDADDNDNGDYNSYCGEEGGEVELMTREGFCHSVAALNVTRLMVYAVDFFFPYHWGMGDNQCSCSFKAKIQDAVRAKHCLQQQQHGHGKQY
jgi:hypothetical protein